MDGSFSSELHEMWSAEMLLSRMKVRRESFTDRFLVGFHFRCCEDSHEKRDAGAISHRR